MSVDMVGALAMWNTLHSWTTVSLVVTVLIGIGVGVLSMTPPEPKIAQWSFTIALVILLARLSWWLAVERDDAILPRFVFVGLVYASVGILWFAGWSLAQSKKAKPYGYAILFNSGSERQPIVRVSFYVPSPTPLTAVRIVIYERKEATADTLPQLLEQVGAQSDYIPVAVPDVPTKTNIVLPPRASKYQVQITSAEGTLLEVITFNPIPWTQHLDLDVIDLKTGKFSPIFANYNPHGKAMPPTWR